MLGKLEDLPLKNPQIIPFNLKEGERTGTFAKIIFNENKIETEKLAPRAIIPNDSKLFAQADLDKTISHFVTSDVRSKNTLTLLRRDLIPKFSIISIDIPLIQKLSVFWIYKKYVLNNRSLVNSILYPKLLILETS